jgi:hypothetical protein
VGGSFDVRTIERSPAVSVFYERTEKAVVIKFISGGERVGPLGSFGIVSGGSSLAFETQRFVKKYKLEPMQIAERKDIAQVQPLIANAERWPENLK